jgi:hypothetical protein
LAIFYAVSILSPVNIQTFILALIRSLIVYGTSSWSLSNTAVAPISIKFVYNWFTNVLKW